MFNNENLQNSFEFIKGFPKIDELTLTNGKMNGSYDIEDLMNDNENLSQLYSFDLNEKILEEIEDLINSGHLSPKDINKSFMEIIKSNNPEKIFHILQKFKSSNSLTKPVEAFTKIDIDYLHINGNAHEIESNHNYKETDNSNINVSHIRQNINTNIIINNQTKLANSIANLSLSGSNINNIDINVELIEDLSELDKIENDNQSNSNDNSNSSYNYLENLTTDKKDNHDIAITKSHKNQIKRGPSETKLKEILDRTGYSHNITAGQRKYGGPPPDWEGSPPSLGCEIYCGKIPKDIFEDELIPLFEGVDRIWDFRLMIDSSNGGASKGFAFVQYPDKEMAEKAVKTLNNYEIRPGKYLKLNISIPNLRLFVGNIPKSKGKDEIFEEFLKLTDGLVDVIVYSTPGEKRKNRGFCFLQYESHLAASVAKKRLTNNLHSNINPTGLGPGPYYYNLGNNNAPTGNLNYNWPFKRVWNCDIIVEWAQVQEEPPQETMAKVKVLYVSNLTNSVEESELKKAFERFGPVQHVKKVKDYAFVHFGERDHALQAMKEMEGSKHIQGQNGIPIKVSLAKPPSDKKNTTNNSNTSSNVALTLNGRRGDFNNNINSNNNSNKEAFLNYGGNGVYGNLGNNFGQIVNQANQCYYYYVGRRPNNFSNLNPGFNTLNTAAFPAPLYNPHSTRLNKYYHLSEGGAFLPSPNSHIHPSSNINYPMYYPPVMQNPSQLSYLSNFQNIQNHQKSNDIMIDGANPINKEEINNSVNSINNATNNLNLVENSNYNCNVPNCNMLSCSSNIDVDRQPQIYNNGVANYLYENCLAASPGRSLVNNAPPLSPLNPKSYETGE
ncbi:putative uncharacterized protein DDB_G0282133 isoform X2 [Gordionus sp. m RMFG-2023]|uniref:putative uncharacterized protein DDB_G0282133 isoform X2 n=1 Tax=Gordionus sp. m RMFG-2023 TaxID=3053472 RepID=UPI0031FBF21F